MKVWNSFLKVKWYVAAQVVLSLIATIAIALIPAYNRHLVDNVFPNKGEGFLPLALAYVISYAIYLITIWGSERFVWKSAIRFENILKKECYSFIARMKYKEFHKRKNEEYLSILTNNITSIEQDYLQPICALIKSAVSIIIYTVIISIYTTPIICITLLLLSILAAFTPKIYKKKLRQAGKEYVDEEATYTKKVSDLLDGAELIDQNSRSAFERKNASFTDILSHKRLLLGKRKVNGNTISGTAILMINAITFILCGVLLLRNSISVGIIVAALTYAQSFTDPVQEILYDINTLNASKDIVHALENEICAVAEATEEPPLKDVILNNIQVSFPEKTLSYNAAFTLGEKYLITGESGHGKSTLLNIIAGRSDIPGFSGCLSENDCFYLSQHQHVFNDTAINNITIFGSYPSPEEAEMEQLPKYNRIISEQDCSVLSGGEKQIMKMLRALVQQKPVLLMDEPFAALDHDNAKTLFHVLSQMNCTILMVSHTTDFDSADLAHWNNIQIGEICHES